MVSGGNDSTNQYFNSTLKVNPTNNQQFSVENLSMAMRQANIIPPILENLTLKDIKNFSKSYETIVYVLILE